MTSNVKAKRGKNFVKTSNIEAKMGKYFVKTENNFVINRSHFKKDKYLSNAVGVKCRLISF